MRTGGMTGEVVGKAAALCVGRRCRPREVYEAHFADLVDMLHLPGEVRLEIPQR
jgi:hypothetical protein